MITKIEPFLISFLIGLLIGIDRERSLPKGMKGMGVRSFILIAMLGTLAAYTSDIRLTTVISLFTFSAILLNYLVTSRGANATSVGLTTSLTAGAVFCLGFIASIDPMLAIVIGVAVLILLLGRVHLHEFARKKLQPNEINAGAALVVIILCVIVFLPNETVDPWGLFNPQRYGLLIAIIATMQFAGYVAIRLFGDKLGVLFMGFFGGLVSSTAVFATLPKFSRNHPERASTAAAAAILATVGMLLEFALIIFIAAPKLMQSVAAPVTAMILSGVIFAALLFRHDKSKQQISTPANPLDLKSVLYLATVIFGMLVVIAITKRFLGTEGVKVVSFLGAMFELHGVSLATATLYIGNKLSLTDARTILLLALLASYVTKFGLVWSLARNWFAGLSTICLSLMILAGAAAAYFTMPMFN